MKSKLAINQKLWFVGREHRARQSGEVTVVKVGRKWADVEGAYRGRIDIETLAADAAGFSSPGTCYLSQQLWAKEQARKLAWSKLRANLANNVPTGLSYAAIVQAGKLLGFDVSANLPGLAPDVEFTPWDGSPLHGPYLPPGLTDETRVEVRFRNGQVHTGSAQSFGWNHHGIHPEVHVVAFRPESS